MTSLHVPYFDLLICRILDWKVKRTYILFLTWPILKFRSFPVYKALGSTINEMLIAQKHEENNFKTKTCWSQINQNVEVNKQQFTVLLFLCTVNHQARWIPEIVQMNSPVRNEEFLQYLPANLPAISPMIVYHYKMKCDKLHNITRKVGSIAWT